MAGSKESRFAAAARQLGKGGPYVGCSGGPRHNYWYDLATWDDIVNEATAAGEDPHEGRTLGYILTQGRAPHPRFPGITGRVARWNPDRVVELARTAPKPSTTKTGA